MSDYGHLELVQKKNISYYYTLLIIAPNTETKRKHTVRRPRPVNYGGKQVVDWA